MCGFESETAFKRAGSQQVMRLDLLADRPDLFDVGGLARALRGTLGIESGPAQVRHETLRPHGEGR